MQFSAQPHTSTYISAGGHAALLGFALFGGLFSAEPLELPTVNVSTISAEEFAALTAPPSAPEIAAEVPALAAPAPEQSPPPPAAVPEPPVPTPAPRPEAVVPPPPEPAPVQQEPPQPREEVVIIPDVAPDATTRPVPRPADRVASEAVAAPDPDTAIDNTAQEATTPDEAAPDAVPEQQEAAPEEATTEIVTEAEVPTSSAPAQTIRPQARPQPTQTTQTVARPQETEQTETNTQDAVAAALAEALGETLGEPDAAAPSGATLSDGEIGGFRLAVQGCWDVDVGSQSADVTVVVSMSMNPDGTVQQGSIVLESATGGEGRAVDTAFLRARRAIYECQKDGYDLPEDRYELWERVEITFNPKQMRVR